MTDSPPRPEARGTPAPDVGCGWCRWSRRPSCRQHVLSKGQSGWSFTVKQGATTIHEDSAAYTISASSLTMEMEAVIHALRWIASRGDSHTTHAIILTDSMSLLHKVKSGMGGPDWNVSIGDIHLRKLLWVYCPGHAGVKGNDRADKLAGKAILTRGLFLGSSEVLRSLRHYLRAQSQGSVSYTHLTLPTNHRV